MLTYCFILKQFEQLMESTITLNRISDIINCNEIL